MVASSLTSQFIAKTSTDSLSVWKAALLKVSGILHVKARYVLTRDNRLRLRYVASAVAGVSVIMGMYAGGLINPTEQNIPSAEMIAQIEPEAGISQAGPILSYVIDRESIADTIFSEKALDAYRDKNGQIRRDPNVKESV